MTLCRSSTLFHFGSYSEQGSALDDSGVSADQVNPQEFQV